MTPRIAFVGSAGPAVWAHAIDALRARLGEFIAVAAYATPVPSTRHGLVVSRYDANDAELIGSGLTLCVLLDDGPAYDDFEAVAMLAGVPCWRPAGDAEREQTMQAHQFLWLDLETTGLDPASGVPLEFAAVLCEDARGDDFRVVQSFTSAIHHEVDALDALRIDRTVLDMHAANGLWKDVQLASVSVADVDAFLAALAADLTGGRERAVRLAGSSVHFDLAWCRVHFPTFARYLSHRVLDVTTLRAAVDVWAPAPVAWPKRDAHRALADIMASIAEARVARAALFGGGK